MPSQLRPKELSRQLRALLWALFHSHLKGTATFTDHPRSAIGEPWVTILYEWHVSHEHKMADEFSSSFVDVAKQVKTIFVSGDYVRVFEFVQWVIRHRSRPGKFEAQVDRVLDQGRAAYRVLDGRTIFPVGSDAERQTLERAFADLDATEFHGARAHLRQAGAELTAG